MPKHPSTITGAAGEHFVAARLAAMGYVVALTRGGSPAVDLLVSNQTGTRSVSVQVKTSIEAWRSYTRGKTEDHWEWPVGQNAASFSDDNLLYAFVNLRNWPDKADGGETFPQVFIVPSARVATWVQRAVDEKWSRIFFWLLEGERSAYLERWSLITDRLS